MRPATDCRTVVTDGASGIRTTPDIDVRHFATSLNRSTELAFFLHCPRTSYGLAHDVGGTRLFAKKWPKCPQARPWHSGNCGTSEKTTIFARTRGGRPWRVLRWCRRRR